MVYYCLCPQSAPGGSGRCVMIPLVSRGLRLMKSCQRVAGDEAQCLLNTAEDPEELALIL